MDAMKKTEQLERRAVRLAEVIRRCQYRPGMETTELLEIARTHWKDICGEDQHDEDLPPPCLFLDDRTLYYQFSEDVRAPEPKILNKPFGDDRQMPR